LRGSMEIDEIVCAVGKMAHDQEVSCAFRTRQAIA
jgi:hypothetical protein